MAINPQLIETLRKDRTIVRTLCGVEMRFQTTWGLFSPRQIDEGSAMLLDQVQVAEDAHIADLGCGYGALGLTLAKRAPQGRAVLLDKDFVAVKYAQKNAELNRLTNVDVRLSNGFEAVAPDEKFDLIVSNLPAKVGNELLTIFVYDAYQALKPNGTLVVVTIAGLAKYIKRQFVEQFGNYKKLKQGKTYTVARAIKDLS
ncbi:MAG: methyltransferase domain-containing protein [Gammaproteobacteria bacterium]|nr:MAG: methyltransferase domain-containing protein [Gammaproteobacteria bacterium]